MKTVLLCGGQAQKNRPRCSDAFFIGVYPGMGEAEICYTEDVFKKFFAER